MKHLMLPFISLTIAGAVFAQTPCTKTDAYHKTGSWASQGADELANADTSFPKAQYTAVLRKAQTVIELLKQANPTPTGLQVSASRAMNGNSYTANGAFQFGARAMYLGYLCDAASSGPKASGKIYLGGETQTWVYVNFNGLFWLINDRMSLGKGYPTADGEIIFYEPRKIGDLKGFTLLKPEIHTDRKEEAVIITASDRSPYKPVSREKFLAARVKFYQRDINKMQKILQVSTADIDKMKAKMASENLLKPQQQAQIVEASLAGQKQRETSFGHAIATDEDEIQKIRAYVDGMSPAERQTQAVVRDPSAALAKLFVSEARGQRLVTVDKGFFDPALPRQAIQMVTVYWSWDENDPPKAEMIRQFKQNFDFGALRQMIGK
jgi:hypothetical protein